MGVSFLFPFAFCFSSFLSCLSDLRQPLCLFAFLFLGDGFDHNLLHQCYKTLSIVPQALCLSDLIPWIHLSLTLCNHKGFHSDNFSMAWWTIQWRKMQIGLSLNLLITPLFSWNKSPTDLCLINLLIWFPTPLITLFQPHWASSWTLNKPSSSPVIGRFTLSCPS